MWQEYKEFLFRGNLLELAVAFILGVSFNAVVTALAENVIMAPIAEALGFDEIAAWTIGGVQIGIFLAAVLSFIVVATVLFFLMKAAMRFRQGEDEEEADLQAEQNELLKEIRDALERQAS